MASERSSLRRRLLVWLLLPLLALFFARAGYTFYYANELANRVYDRMLFTLTSSLSQQIVHDTERRSMELPLTAARLLMTDEVDLVYFAIRDDQGRVIDGESTMPDLPAPGKPSDRPFFNGKIKNKDVRIAYLPLTIDHQPYLVQVAETLHKRSLLAREFQSGTLLPQALIIILASLIVWFGIGKSLAPLKRLQMAVSERSHLDLSPLPEHDISSDVQPLIQAINDLMARLSNVLEVQNRFIADAAHQLRTPLAGLKTQIELALRQNDAALTRQSIQNLLASTDRMTHLVNQLLTLARNEPKADGAIRRTPLDLGLVASHVAMAWVPRALTRDIDLGFEPPSMPVTIDGDPARIKDLLDNLIDNAVRYTPPQGQVTVSVLCDQPPRLVVTDNGPGIPLEQRERVFERFYSLLGNGAEGSGLGLAIVREIARIHGAEVFIDSAPEGAGTRVSVVFAKN